MTRVCQCWLDETDTMGFDYLCVYGGNHQGIDGYYISASKDCSKRSPCLQLVKRKGVRFKQCSKYFIILFCAILSFITKIAIRVGI